VSDSDFTALHEPPSFTLSAPGGLPASDQVQPQELVITILGTYVRPFCDRVWSFCWVSWASPRAPPESP